MKCTMNPSRFNLVRDRELNDLYFNGETYQLCKHGHYVNTGQKGLGTQQILDGSPPLIILIDNSGKTTKHSKRCSFQRDAINFPRIRKHYFEIENRHGDDYDDNAVNMDILHSAQFSMADMMVAQILSKCTNIFFLCHKMPTSDYW